mgnify:CR=1 FL=1
MNEFYVGYLPKAPEGLGHTLRRIIVGLNFVAVVVVLLLLIGQQPFADSRFEFLAYRDYQGLVTGSPYPSLRTENGRFLLVSPGKHGATDLVREFNFRDVQLEGALIRRADNMMLEILPGSIRAVGSTGQVDQITDLGPITLTGEIVDSKCYFGVMNPGNGKVHRDCAARCISGGIPPGFVVKDASGTTRTLILSGIESREVLDFVAEPVRIRGRLQRLGDMLILVAERSGNKLAIERD